MTENHALNCSTGGSEHGSKYQPDQCGDRLWDGGPIFGLYDLAVSESRKKQDALQDRFLEQIEALRTKSEEDVSELRDRYDSVIGSMNAERTQIRSNIAGQVSKLDEKLDKSLQRIDGLMINQETMLSMAKDQLTERKARSAAASMVRQLKDSGGSDTSK